ncbi:MAG: hypothetical protein WAN04_03315, partial [Candidatus Udaeobacter sp.]
MLNPNEPVQMIASGEAVYIPIPVLVQTARDVIRDSDIQRSAVFVGDNVHPIVVVAHAAGVIRDVGKPGLMFRISLQRFAQHDKGEDLKIERQLVWVFNALLYLDEKRHRFF